MKKILYIEDDQQIQKAVVTFLNSKGFDAIGVSNAKSGINIIIEDKIDLLLLDLSLPDLSGEDVSKWVKTNYSIPIIMLTAKVDEEHVVKGFESGAQDYLKKPFGLKELLVRIQSILSINNKKAEELLFNNGHLKINENEKTVKLNNVKIHLTNTEYKILRLLVTNPTIIFSRSQLVESILGYDYLGYDRTIDAHIKNIRFKLSDKSKNTNYIKTIRGVGYKFNEDES